MKSLRRHRFLINSAMAMLMACWQVGQPLAAADNAWTGATNAAWDTVGNWSAGLPDAAANAIFGTPAPLTGSTITLGSGSLANSLAFFDNYTFDGGDLSLTGGGILVGQNRLATIQTQILGIGGLEKTGPGFLRLLNTSSTYTGQTRIINGVLAVNSTEALGMDTSAVVVTGNTLRNSGFAGGSLVVGSGMNNLAGTNFSRDLDLTGGGRSGDAFALYSTGNNILSGSITTGANPTGLNNVSGTPITATGTTLGAAFGTTQITGPVSIGPIGQATTFGGNGIWILDSVVDGLGNLQKTGPNGTLVLNGANTFGGVLNMIGGFLRVSHGTNLGVSTATSALDMQAGTLEIRTDAPASFSNRRLRINGNSTYFLDHGIGTNTLNQTITMAVLTLTANRTATFNTRNGTGISFVGNMATTDLGNPNTFTVNGNGLLTVQGTFWANSNSTARVMTINGAGNMLITGSVTGTNAAHVLTKAGTGTLTINGTASTFFGAANVQNGTLVINDFRSINNNNTGASNVTGVNLNLGSGTGTGTLRVTGTNPSVANLTMTRTLRLAGSTGGGVILADHGGANGILIANVETPVDGNKTLTLGGSNTNNNTISGSLNNPATGTFSLAKTGTGTWVLSGENGYTGASTINNGTLKIQANAATSTILADSSGLTFNTNGGTLEFTGQDGAANIENLGTLTLTAGAGKVSLSPGAAGTASLNFSSMAAPAAALRAGINFTGGTGGNEFIITGATVGTILAPQAVFNGSHFAFVGTGGVLREPDYASDSGFSTSAGGTNVMASTAHWELTGDVTGQATRNINSLRMAGSSLTLSGALNVNTQGLGSGAASAGGIVSSGTSVITGSNLSSAGSGALIFTVADGQLTVNSVIPAATTGGISKNGPGLLVLGGTNLNTSASPGGITINEGILRLGNNQANLGATNQPLIIRRAGTLDVNGISITSRIASINGEGVITNSSSTPAGVTVGSNNGTGIWAGIFEDGTGGLSVTKTGTGAQTWSGLNTYSGVTTIASTGIVSIPNLANIGSSSGLGRGDSSNNTTNAGSLVFTGTSTTQAYGGINYTGTTSVEINRLFTFNGAANGGARIQANGVNGATLVFSNTAPLLFGASAAGNPQGLVLGGAGTGDNLFNPLISDNDTAATSVYKSDAGLWILGNAANSYTGVTQINAGILRGQSGTTLPTASNLVINGGVFESTGALNRTLGSGPGNLRWTANAAGGFSAGNSKLTVDLGTGLVWGSTTDFVGTGGLVFSSATSLAEVELVSGFELTQGIAATLSLTTTAGSATVNLASGTTAGLAIGQVITGNPNIPDGVTIATITSPTSFTISSGTGVLAATGVNTNVASGGFRQITVNDNTSTGTDFATISGVISGNGTMAKLGTGMLVLKGANTYTGDTRINGGTLAVFDIGNTASISSNLGAGSAKLTIGTGGTAGTLIYAGAGETTNRLIELSGTTAGVVIDSSGSGPLVLTNLVNASTGTGGKTLTLRGSLDAPNEITIGLTNNANGGVLSVTKDGAGTWILSGDSTYTGNTSVVVQANTAVGNTGSLGLGLDSTGTIGAVTSGPIGTGTLVITNGHVFAAYGDRVLANNVTLTGNAGAHFSGEHSITLNGNVGTTTAGTTTVNNSISQGSFLIINSPQYRGTEASTARTLAFNGSGDTILNSSVTNSTGGAVHSLTYQGHGSLTLGGSNGVSTYTGTTTITSGLFKIGVADAIPSGTGFGNVLINPGLDLTATLDLNGFNQTVNGLTANTAGTSIINNSGGTAATFTFGANDQAVDFLGEVRNTGAGALALVKTGTATAVLSGGPFQHKGSTIVNAGTLTISGAVTATNELSVANGAVLNLAGDFQNSGLVTSISVGDGGVLNLQNGAGTSFNQLQTLTLGASSGTLTELFLNAGTGNTDSFTLLTGGSLNLFSGNQIRLNINDTGLEGNTSYVLFDATAIGGGLLGNLNISDWLLNGPGGFSSLSLSSHSDTNQIILRTGNLITGDWYWNKGSEAWNSAANWDDAKSSGAVRASAPGAGSDVIFVTDSVTGGAGITTTLEQNFKINSLTFEASTVPANTPAFVNIEAGALSSARLEVAPQDDSDGIAISAGGPDAANIKTAFKIGADQTWNVADSGSVLTFEGAMQGGGAVNKAGSGKVVLISAADSSFNPGNTTVFTVNGGTLELQNSAALGTTIAGNAASVTLGGGLFLYNGATATLNNAITFAGGTLGAATGNSTYNAPVTVSSASGIFLGDQYAATPTGRTIALSGGLSGAGKLTIDSVTTVSSGNQITGILTLNGDNSAWSGGFDLLRGDVRSNNANGFGTGPINISLGKVAWQGPNGATYTVPNNITIADAVNPAVAEFNVDNTSTPSVPFTANFTGQVTLGGAGGVGELRIFQADNINSQAVFQGGIVLAHDARIIVRDGAASVATINTTGISETGGPRNLGINVNPTWGGTVGTLQIDAASSYTGGTTLGGGRLRFGHKDAIGTGTLTISGGTLAASTELTGLNGVPNAVTLAAALTMDGAFSLEMKGNMDAGAVARTLTANGAAGTEFILSGLITNLATVDGSALTLAGNGLGAGVIAGGINMTGDLADLTVSTGNWIHRTGTSRIGDDVTVTGASSVLTLESGLFQVRDDFTVTVNSVLNLHGTGVLSFDVTSLSADASLRATAGGMINLGANDAVVASQFDGLRIGTDAGGAAGVLNMGVFNQTVTEFILGNRQSDRTGVVNGIGTLTVSGNLDLYDGIIHASLASTGSTAFEKIGLGTVTLRGDNSGLTSTGNTIVYSGTLFLDYTANNNTKIRELSALDLRGGALQILGSASAATSQSVNGLTLASLGESLVTVVAGSGQDVLLNLGGITRAASAGIVRFELPSGSQTGSHGILTTTGTSADGILGSGTAFATVNDGTGVWFAGKSGDNIVALVSTAVNDLNSWAAGMNVTSSGAGFTGGIGDETKKISSLRFDAASGGSINLQTGGVLDIRSGGVLITSNSTSGPLGFFGGEVRAENGEMVVINESSQDFEISSTLGRALRLTKGGTGTLVLSGSNALAGELQINKGTVRIAGGDAISDMARVFLAMNNNNTTLQLTANETIGRLEGGRASSAEELGIVNIGSHHLKINQTDFDGTPNENFIYDGKFAGNGTVTKLGNDYLTLRGASLDFTGNFNVENGRLDLQGGLGRLSSVSAFTVGAGAVILARQDQTSTIDRLANSAPITLNNTAGTAAVTGREGLWLYNTQNGTRTETVGTLHLGAGHNTVRIEPQNTGTSTLSDLVMAGIVRDNRSTVVINGLNLGATTGRRGRIRVAAGGQAALEADEVGAGSGSGTQFRIIPYIICAATTGGVGNSFVTNVDATVGLRPLAAGEYVTNSAGFNGLTGASADNVRFDANPGAALTGTATSINSLVIDGAAAITLDGPASALEITSGALLAAQNVNHSIQGFTSITTGGGRDYTIYNTGTGTLTIASALSGSVPLVKSGQGVLSLTNSGNAFTDVYLNQGFVLADSYDKLGTGGLNFHGGGLRLAAGFASDLGAKSWQMGTGGGVLDTNGVVSVNATDLSMSGSGEFRKTGVGALNISGTFAGGHTGPVVINRELITLNVSTANAFGAGGIHINGLTSTTTATELRLLASDQISDAAIVTLTTGNTNNQLFNLNDFNETIGGLVVTSTSTSGSVVRTGSSGVLTVAGDIVLNNNRTTDVNTTEFQVLITGTGAVGTRTTNGTLDLAGGVRRITVETSQANQNFRNDAVIETVIQNGGIIKDGRRALHLRAANTYAGGTTVLEGALLAANTSGSATGLGSVLVGRDAVLGGNGIIAPAADNHVTVNGTLLVGGMNDAARQLTITTTGTGLTTVNGIVAFDIFGGQGSGALNAQAGNNDQLVIGGNSGFSIGAGSQLQVSTSLPITEGTWVVGTEWRLFDWSGLTGGVTGTFDNLSEPAPFNYMSLPDLSSIGLAWDVSNLYTAGTIMVVVPEPGRMLLLFFGLAGLFFRRRR